MDGRHLRAVLDTRGEVPVALDGAVEAFEGSVAAFPDLGDEALDFSFGWRLPEGGGWGYGGW